ncbi:MULTISPECIES: hypothetical protein [Bacillus cereus group]|uniref:hypothetical protein n=1 Tax=Bacillus cereus group TaxID=86661 RepID=UPI001596EB68|nr:MULTISPECIES: hypothetical protein [Bacillus cereus group]
MKKLLTLVVTFALVGVLYISPTKEHKEQSVQTAKVFQENTYRMMVDPGGGMG